MRVAPPQGNPHVAFQEEPGIIPAELPSTSKLRAASPAEGKGSGEAHREKGPLPKSDPQTPSGGEEAREKRSAKEKRKDWWRRKDSKAGKKGKEKGARGRSPTPHPSGVRKVSLSPR